MEADFATIPVTDFVALIGELGLFGFRAIGRAFTPPFELQETVSQIYDAGWRSLPLVIASGFAFGIILALQTRAEMQSFGAGGMIPQAVSTGLFHDIGALIAALLVAGRVGAGIGAFLAKGNNREATPEALRDTVQHADQATEIWPTTPRQSSTTSSSAAFSSGVASTTSVT